MDYGKFDDDKPIRVIDHDGSQMGIITMADALAKAKELGLDLVEVDPEAKPPVFRIMDYGKFDYDKRKRRQANLKEIRVRPKAGQHDIDFKVKQAIGFLQARRMLCTIAPLGK